MAKPQPESDLSSVDKTGKKVDAWVCEELLGDDPLHPEYTHVLGEGDDEDADVEDDL